MLQGLRWAVFEPNNIALWKGLERTITEFLTRVWQAGALFGRDGQGGLLRQDRRGAQPAGRARPRPGASSRSAWPRPGPRSSSSLRSGCGTAAPGSAKAKEKQEMARHRDSGSTRSAASTSWSRSTASRRRSFIECSGLGSTTEVIENREGGDNGTVRKLPGKTTLRRHHPEVGGHRLHRAVGLAPADHRRRRRAQERLDRRLRPGQRHRGRPLELRPAPGRRKWEGPAVQRQGQRHRHRHAGARARGADPGVSADGFRHRGRVRAAQGLRRRRRQPAPDGRDAAGHRRRRDLPAEGSRGCRLAGLPDRHPAVPSGDAAGQRLPTSTRASSRACSPRTWRYLQDLYNRINGLTPRTVSVDLPALRAEQHAVEVPLLGG